MVSSNFFPAIQRYSCRELTPAIQRYSCRELTPTIQLYSSRELTLSFLIRRREIHMSSFEYHSTYQKKKWFQAISFQQCNVKMLQLQGIHSSNTMLQLQGTHSSNIMLQLQGTHSSNTMLQLQGTHSSNTMLQLQGTHSFLPDTKKRNACIKFQITKQHETNCLKPVSSVSILDNGALRHVSKFLFITT